MLRIYDIGDKLLSGIKSMYVDSIACGRVKVSDNECFKIDSGVRQRCIMSPWLFHVYIDAVKKEVKMEMGKMGVKFLEEQIEWRFPHLFYSGDLVLCSELEELKMMVGSFIDLCK